MGAGFRGLVAAWLGLTLLSVLVKSSTSANSLAGAASLVNTGLKKLIDPAIPAIPDLAKSGTAGGGGQSLPGLGLLAPLSPLITGNVAAPAPAPAGPTPRLNLPIPA